VDDFTDLATGAGFIYVAFVVDVFTRRIIGWQGPCHCNAAPFRSCSSPTARPTMGFPTSRTCSSITNPASPAQEFPPPRLAERLDSLGAGDGHQRGDAGGLPMKGS
jgi:hypothetical protein